MASVARRSLIDQQVNTATFEGGSQSVGQGDARFRAFLRVTDYVGGTFNCDIEHSPDGTNWFTLHTFAALAANGALEADITTDSVFPNVRANADGGAGADATIRVDLYYDKHR
jgi:hypothetical protein